MTFHTLINIWKKIKEFQQSVFNFLVLHIVYFIGIGLTAMVAKAVGKHFLTREYQSTSWQKAGTTKPVASEHMF